MLQKAVPSFQTAPGGFIRAGGAVFWFWVVGSAAAVIA